MFLAKASGQLILNAQNEPLSKKFLHPPNPTLLVSYLPNDQRQFITIQHFSYFDGNEFA